MPRNTFKPIRIDGERAYVTLSQGYEAIIDFSDLDLVSNFNWYCLKSRNTVYAKRNIYGTRSSISLHRFLMGDPKGLEVDHIDLNGLNNTRGNLRVATRRQNSANAKKPSTNTSGYKGVSWCRKSNKWVSQIWVNGENIKLGRFEDVKDAHLAYCDAVSKYRGDFGRTE
jgi:hypothetical protein